MDSQPPRSRIRRWFSTGAPTVLLILGVAGATGAAYSIADEGSDGSRKDGPPGPPHRLSDEQREEVESAFEQCKGELPDELRQRIEEHKKNAEAIRSCMEEKGIEPPDRGERRPEPGPGPMVLPAPPPEN
jgi:hypothetical protein